jgi:hypothetical protein
MDCSRALIRTPTASVKSHKHAVCVSTSKTRIEIMKAAELLAICFILP